MQTFAGSVLQSALESADSSPESAGSNTNFVIVVRLPGLHMFNISKSIQSAKSIRRTANWQGLTIQVSGRPGQPEKGTGQIDLVICLPGRQPRLTTFFLKYFQHIFHVCF